MYNVEGRLAFVIAVVVSLGFVTRGAVGVEVEHQPPLGCQRAYAREPCCIRREA
jgi:hypothetical protein